VCNDTTINIPLGKGSTYFASDEVPQGITDIDFVVRQIGHQLGVIFCMSWKKLTTNVVNQKWFNNYGN
jgi:hypothetical protein